MSLSSPTQERLQAAKEKLSEAEDELDRLVMGTSDRDKLREVMDVADEIQRLQDKVSTLKRKYR